MPKPAQYGDTLAREVDLRIAAPVANTAAITALPATERANGMQILEEANGSTWWFDADSTAVAGPSVLVPDAGDGRWLATGGGGAAGVGVVNMLTVLYASAGAIGAYTRTGNVILADAVGALGAQDGITGAAGDRFLLMDGAAGADNGPYRIDVIGDGAAKFQMTRIGEADASAEVTAGMLVYISKGTTRGNKWAYLTTDDDIVLNTTSLDFAMVPQAAELAATTVGAGGDLIGLYDVGGIVTATTCGAAIIENRTALDVAEASLVTAEAALVTHRPGMPMQNIVRILGAPGVIVAGDTITIGTDIYEANANTPPSAGTAGSIWVYQDVSSAAFRGHLINAINNVTDANNITYDGAVAENFVAAAGITTGDVMILSADAPGGTPTASAVATACSETLTTGTDIWDNATCQYGFVQTPSAMQAVVVTVGAEELARGTMDVTFPFTPRACWIRNRSRDQDEAYTITGDTVSLTLAGGGSPNNQSADVIDFIAFE
jgi:hypothetical protein